MLPPNISPDNQASLQLLAFFPSSYTTPFQMDLALIEGSLVFDRPWRPEPTASATPVTSLRGAVCQTITAWPEHAPDVAFLRNPPSRHHSGQVLPAIIVQMDPTEDPRRWIVRGLSRGTGAHTHTDMMRNALPQAGTRGLRHAGKSVGFQFVEERVTHTNATDWVRHRLSNLNGIHTVTVHLATPCHASSFELRDLIGNMAASLTKLEHALRNDPSTTKRAIEDDADAARHAARESFAHVIELERHLVPGPKGQRTSGETGHRIPLQGMLGSFVLGGTLDEALPWLALAELHGLGQHVAFGMGRVRLSFRSKHQNIADTQSA